MKRTKNLPHIPNLTIRTSTPNRTLQFQCTTPAEGGAELSRKMTKGRDKGRYEKQILLPQELVGLFLLIKSELIRVYKMATSDESDRTLGPDTDDGDQVRAKILTFF